MDQKHELTNGEAALQRAAFTVEEDCRKYGIYGTLVNFAPSPFPESDRNRLYIVAGLDPALSKKPVSLPMSPAEILRRSERNKKLFYPKLWAYDLTESKSDIHARISLVDYCKTAKTLVLLYGEYGAELPEKLRMSEINQLIEYRSVLDNPNANDALKARCKKALDHFFKREKSKSKFRQQWLSYYRSEHFPDNKGAIARLIGYFKRNSNKTNVKRMMEVSGKLHKKEMQEHEYKLFAKLMKQKHPDVVFSTGDKEVVDHGLMHSFKRNDAFGRPVTGEEFAVIRKERFATESFAAIADLRPSYFEFRDVYYKAVDEPLVAGVYNQVTLSYAKCNSLMEMREHGTLGMEQIPLSDFMNFVSLAKANGLRFYIDNDGDFANPTFSYVNVIYNSYQENKLAGIKARMIFDKVEHSHILEVKHPSLSSKLHSIEKTSQGKAHSQPTHSYDR